MERKHLLQRMTMPLPELERYYRERRKERFDRGEPFRGVALRRVLHPLLLGGMKMLHLLNRQKITILGDKRVPTDRPILFAASHIGWNDIEMIFSSIGDHTWLFWGDPKVSYRTMDGLLLDMNGIIVCDTQDKTDRAIAKANCINWLLQGGNLLIFPEGAWNVTENLPVMPLFPGAAEMAIRTGAEIVPLAIEQYGRSYTVNIGENIRPAAGDEKGSLTVRLRDAMSTLKWEIWESKPPAKRAQFPPDVRERELQSRLHIHYTMGDVNKTRFRTREEREQEDAFAHLDRLIPRRENAFLFRKVP